MNALRLSLHGLWLAACLAPLAAAAQDAKAPAAAPAACEARAGAPQWLPCGPDRVLTEAEVKAQLFRDGMVTRMLITSGKTGKKFFMHLKPGGKLDAGMESGTNIGKSWRFQDGKLCRDYYRLSDVHCSSFELQGATLYVVGSDDVRSPVDTLEFAKP